MKYTEENIRALAQKIVNDMDLSDLMEIAYDDLCDSMISCGYVVGGQGCNYLLKHDSVNLFCPTFLGYARRISITRSSAFLFGQTSCAEQESIAGVEFFLRRRARR